MQTDLETTNSVGGVLSEFSGAGGSIHYDGMGNPTGVTANVPGSSAATGNDDLSVQDELRQEQYTSGEERGIYQ